jgi:hypothetical protein
VLFFGDLFKATAATVGINPSHREYLDESGKQLVGMARRFETLSSLGAVDRPSLTDTQCYRAVATMRAYFRPSKPVYQWFQPLRRVLEGMGLHYESGEVTHLDLVQEATNPTWSGLAKLRPRDAESLLGADEEFLRWQLGAFKIGLIICNGKTPLDAVQKLVGASVACDATIARQNWSVAIGTIADRRVIVAGWNIPMSSPTGLSSQDPFQLGQTLASAVRATIEPKATPRSAGRRANSIWPFRG